MTILYILGCGMGILSLFSLLLFAKKRGANSGYTEFELTRNNYYGFYGESDE